MDVWIVRADGSVENVLSLQRDSPYSSRPVAYPEMVAPFVMAAGEEVTVMVRYWSEGTSHLAFSVETADSFSTLAVTRMSKNFAYYGMIVVLMLAAGVAGLMQRKIVFLAYIAYAGATLLFLAHADGTAFAYLWPGWPLFNSIASIVTGGAFIVMGCTYARIFLQTKPFHPVMDKILQGMIVLTLLVGLSALVIDGQIIKQAFIPLALAAILLCAFTGICAARERFMQVRFYILAWIGAGVSSLIMNLRHITGVEFPQDFVFDSMRVAMVFDALMMGLAIADQFHQLRKSRHKALTKSLDDARRNLDLNARLGSLERQYALVLEGSHAQSAQLADTVHDLRQPLNALRLNVVQLARDPSGKDQDVTKINETFTYLESLLANQLNAPVGTDGDRIESGGKPNSQDLTVQQILASIHEMFQADAESKGLQFSFIRSRHEAVVEPLVLMRIVSNLVSNAIKYTGEGRILLGTRKRAGYVRVEVHDTGSGMSGEEFADALHRTVRLDRDRESADGHGYGLAIIMQLVSQKGFRLLRDGRRKTGTSIYLEIPCNAGPTQRETALSQQLQSAR